MALPVKRKTPIGKAKKGATKTDDGKGKPRTVMNRGVAGLTDGQAKGGEEPEFFKKSAPKSKPKATKQGMY